MNMTGTKKPPEGGFPRDTKAVQGCSISNNTEVKYTTCKSVCKQGVSND